MSVLSRMARLVLAGSIFLLLGIGDALAQVAKGSGYGLPEDVSLEGYRIDRLIQQTTVFVTILFAVMCLWIVYSCVFHNEKRHKKADYDHGNARKQSMKAMILACLIFFVVDGNLMYHSTIDVNTVFWNFDRAEAAPNHLKVQINARQWAWQFHYAGTDNKFGTEDDVYTFNEMRIPVDAPILAQLGAVDVIHSFYLPNLRVKTDAVPGTVNTLWFQATRTGEFDIACAQHCGTHHYKMKGLLRIMTRADFDAWHTRASQSAKSTFDKQDTNARWGWPWSRG
jgi:cytochrome c oxidase subunit 2